MLVVDCAHPGRIASLSRTAARSQTSRIDFQDCQADAKPYVRCVVRVFLASWLGCVVVFAASTGTAAPARPSGKVLKVLPHLLDLEGRHTLSPSLFDRDAYQAELRNSPEKVSGIRYDVLWKAKRVGDQLLTLRIELVGTFEGKEPRQRKLETVLAVKSSAKRWTGVAFTGDDYRQFGTIHAWHATLWSGDTLLGEQKSFLW